MEYCLMVEYTSCGHEEVQPYYDPEEKDWLPTPEAAIKAAEKEAAFIETGLYAQVWVEDDDGNVLWSRSWTEAQARRDAEESRAHMKWWSDHKG